MVTQPVEEKLYFVEKLVPVEEDFGVFWAWEFHESFEDFKDIPREYLSSKDFKIIEV